VTVVTVRLQPDGHCYTPPNDYRIGLDDSVLPTLATPIETSSGRAGAEPVAPGRESEHAGAVRPELPLHGAETVAVPLPSEARLLRVGSDRAVVISDGGVMIGRDQDSDLVVSGPEVSRRHGLVRRSMGGYVLTDVSRNGTYVNGRRVRRARVLRAGDVIRIGQAEFRFEVRSAPRDARAALPTLLLQHLAQVQNVVRRADFSRRLATMWRAPTASVLSYFQRVRPHAFPGGLRRFWTIWASVTVAWRTAVRRRRPVIAAETPIDLRAVG
jgi:hypothetical protein